MSTQLDLAPPLPTERRTKVWANGEQCTAVAVAWEYDERIGWTLRTHDGEGRYLSHFTMGQWAAMPMEGA